MAKKSLPKKRGNDIRVIPTKKVNELIVIRHNIANFEDGLKELRKQQDEAESVLITMLKDRYTPGPGCPDLVIKIDWRRNIAWKKHFISRLGQKAADLVWANTEQTKTEKLEITK